jgi:transmembrane sensor
MDEILVKYLLGETSEKEEQQVKLWIAESVDNEKYYMHFKIIWDESRKLELSSHVDENAAWQRFQTFLPKKDSGKVEINHSVNDSKARSFFLRIAVAACLFLTIGIASYFYITSNTTISAGDRVLIKTLPDNSVITLNKNSTLSYKKSFNEKERLVRLSGEAFFNVAPNKQKPFEIKVGNVIVTVVGTSFNIKADEEGTEVIVETGIVTVQIKNKSTKMLPHQKIFIGKGSEELVVEPNQDELYNYYRTNEFICNNTPLSQLVDALNKNYNVHIKILNPEAGKLRLTTRFSKENLDDILKIISGTLDVKIEHKKNEIFIK